MVRRKSLRMTQEELAEKLGVSTQMISNLELGKKAIRPDNLAKVCEDIYMKYVDNAKSISFGAEICVAYLIKASYASKMLRMAIASKQTGVSPTKIKESIGKF